MPRNHQTNFSFHPTKQDVHNKIKESSTDLKEEGMRSENLDARLNRLMLGEDLPLFLQEFAEEWQEVRMRKFVKERGKEVVKKEFNKNKDKKVVSLNTAKALKKELKRLGKHDEGLNTSALEVLGKRMLNSVKKQLKEDILDHLVAEQLDNWFLIHNENHSETVHLDEY